MNVIAGNRVSILPDGVLHIRDVRNEDQMSMYTCTTRNVLTDDEKSSGFAYLRVHGQSCLLRLRRVCVCVCVCCYSSVTSASNPNVNIYTS